MDFEAAARRLERDQSKLKKDQQQQRRRLGSTFVSAQSKREAELRKQQQQKIAKERQRQRRFQEYLQSYIRSCDRALGVQSLLPRDTAAGTTTTTSSSLQLQATSIWGEGDKIALPPIVLERLTQSMEQDDDDTSQQQQQQQPWTFRIGILNPDYKFPASQKLQSLAMPASFASDDDDDDHDMDDVENDDDDDEIQTEAYREELGWKYLAYTHGSVVEFTQDEGFVGLPEPIARALLMQAPSVPTFRTKDLASTAIQNDHDTTMKTADDDDNNNNNTGISLDPIREEEEDDGGKTPGHLAWGQFDLPETLIEITRVRLPKGKNARLIPTDQAIADGFYKLTDIKYVLEQSLVRTRATLSVHDIIHVWHRGKSFELRVETVSPSTFAAVSCINTDLEIEFGEPSKDATESTGVSSITTSNVGVLKETTLGGRRLRDEMDTSAVPTAITHKTPEIATSIQSLLLPEPPMGVKEGIVTVQIRAGNGVRGQRRFDIAIARIQHVFDFAVSLGITGEFQLVTRLPRREFRKMDGHTTLQDAGIAAGQQLLLVEALP
jgi:hypothetical protein